MSQLSLIPALEAARFPSASYGVALQSASPLLTSPLLTSPMAVPNRPSVAQVSYLKKLTRIRTDAQLTRFVVRKLGLEGKSILTRHDFAQAIDLEVREKRWAA